MWWESRVWGLVAVAQDNATELAKIWPSNSVNGAWGLLIEDGEIEFHRTHTLARDRAEKILGAKVKWYFYRVDGGGRGKGKPRSDR